MPEFRVHRVLDPTQVAELVGRPVPDSAPVLAPSPEDHTEVTYIRDETTGELIALITLLDPVTRAALRAAVQAIRNWPGTARTMAGMGGEMANSRTFGWAPKRVRARMEACRATTLAAEQPEQHRVLVDLGTALSAAFHTLFPERAAADATLVGEAVSADWTTGPGSLFTSGVLNRKLQLPYHYDSQNFDTWSAMPTLRYGVGGGWLHLPEWGFAFPCADGEVTWFCGRRQLHGVTPMAAKRATRSPGYRYSIVYYALRGMADCTTHALETGYAMTRRTERERGIAARARGEA